MKNRRYDIDALRVLAFGILILYHCGMLYVPGWSWHIKSSHSAEGLATLMQFVNAWRMPLLFLISGAAIAFAAPERNLSRFIRQRAFRILFPLLMAMIFTVPLQAYVQAVANHSIEPGLLSFLVRYFTFQPWPAGAFDGAEVGFTWNHLWYLPYLFMYTVLLLAVIKLVHGVSTKPLFILKIPAAWRFMLIYIGLGLFVTWLKMCVKPNFPETHALYNDVFAHPYYFSFFCVGYWLGRPAANSVWGSLSQYRVSLLLLALGCFVLMQTYQMIPLHSVYTLLMLATILGFGYHHLNDRENKLARFSRAVFPWYILHQTYIVLLAYLLLPLQLGLWAEAFIVIVGTFMGCWVTYRYILLPLPILHAAFGIFSRHTTRTHR